MCTVGPNSSETILFNVVRITKPQLNILELLSKCCAPLSYSYFLPRFLDAAQLLPCKCS